ncbi:lipase family alpha/beta hydrolase [Nocardioides donggukensis]|uniref:Lipase n=1 Tax=Nocardioides donggukensis TaxID=2774019 RepID=A0A927PYX7_9ACTN|nr:lipase [Nocardioides donggukensis]MBD8868050.1 lipase [Nocardioides donggukensis]
MLDHLAPARRRVLLGVAGLVAVLLVGTAAGLLLGGEAEVEPVAQDEPGPVLLVPGYGGSTSAVDVLARALEDAGRQTEVVRAPGDGRGDLRGHAERLAEAALRAVEAGAPSVDVVGYSAGGVVARLWVDELGGGSLARRVVTLASPHHGTDLAALAGGLAPEACPEACRQLAPDSELLRRLNAGDETPEGPRWVAVWTADDQTVVPPDSGALEGAVAFSLQSVCPGLRVAHADVPRVPAVAAITLAALGPADPAVPDDSVCTGPEALSR